jgi:predicted hydrocarbon binding protein
MNIEKLINELGKNFGKALVKKEDDDMQVMNLEDTGSSEILRIILKSLIVKKEYNKAENFLFEEIEKDKSEANYKVAVDFYEELLAKSDEELIENNFSREEVLQGLKDLELIFKKI